MGSLFYKEEDFLRTGDHIFVLLEYDKIDHGRLRLKHEW